jgi:AhpD family alkylhydroperoxidase
MSDSRECYDKPVWTLGRLTDALTGLPGHLARVAPSLSGRVLSNELRERIMLAVAAENRCGYCQQAHDAIGRAVGLTPEELEAIALGADDVFDARTQAALGFARDLARRNFDSRDEDLYQALLEHFSPAQAAAVEATAHLMNFFNRFGNTFDAARARLSGRCATTRASVMDLAVVSSIFVAVAPWVALPIGALQTANRLRGR